MKNRVRIELATTSAAHPADLVARLQELGATPADVGQGDVPWTVLADPEGNEFCVLEPRLIYQDTGPMAAVVVDCADPRAMAPGSGKLGEAVDWTLHKIIDDHAVLRSAKGVGPYLEFLRTPDVKTVWNRAARPRIHLDLRQYSGDDQTAKDRRASGALGATDIDVSQGNVQWTCLANPEGDGFYVPAPRIDPSLFISGSHNDPLQRPAWPIRTTNEPKKKPAAPKTRSGTHRATGRQPPDPPGS